MQEHLLIPKVFLKDMDAIFGVLSLKDLTDEHAVKVAVYKYGRVASAQALMIEIAQDRVMNGFAKKALNIIQKWEIPNFPISGEDLIKMCEDHKIRLFYPFSPTEHQKLYKHGKIPSLNDWPDTIALDDLMTQSALNSFAKDQDALDNRIRSLLT